MTPNLCPKTKFKTAAAAAILNLLQVTIFDTLPTLCYNKLNHHIKFQENIYDRIIITFRFSECALLDFLKADFWPMHRITLLIFHHCTKFCAKMLIEAEIMAQH